jgi:hypothetical protein
LFGPERARHLALCANTNGGVVGARTPAPAALLLSVYGSYHEAPEETTATSATQYSRRGRSAGGPVGSDDAGFVAYHKELAA